ncbi:MAG: hypothetical protein HY528_04120 [Chloroflexi bacterium]|nr:hypothetical protein [Chloroflexota bacterium]
MTLLNIRRILQYEHLLLLPILGLAFYIAFIPHLNYPYPLHVDEWVHLARSQAIVQAGSTTFADPFSGQETLSLSSNLEASFQLFWGVFQAISGISWMVIFRYFPGIIFIITVLSVYIMARREGFGWEATFFTCLIPSTVGILGPAFLVPVSMGLLFTPLILFITFNFRTIWSYLLIFILISFLLAIHAPSAISPIIVLTPYILLNLKGNFKHSLGIVLALLLPFLIVFPWIFDLLLTTAGSLLIPNPPTEYVQLPKVIESYFSLRYREPISYLPILVFLLGVFLLALRGGKKNYGLVLGLLALLLMLVTFFTFHYGVAIMYERGLMFLMLMISIIAGAGLTGIKNLRLPGRVNTWLRMPLITQNAGRFFCLAIIAITLVIAIPHRLATPYYQMIDSEDYQAFVWIRNNVSQDYEKAILDPWKATAFTAITGKQVFTRIHTAHGPQDLIAYDFLRGGSTNTTMLNENEISIIYTRLYDGAQNRNFEFNSNNPNLVMVAKNIYLLKKVEEKE